MTRSLLPAARWQRLLAAGIDFVTVAALALFLALATGAFEHHQDWVGARPQMRAYGLALLSYLLINLYFLSNAGQTLGKKLVGIRMVARSDNRTLETWRYALRVLPLCCVAVIWFDAIFIVIFLVNLLPMLTPQRRCLHDYLADTWVVRVDAQDLLQRDGSA